MPERKVTSPDYGNWVSTKLIYGSIVMSIPFLVLYFVFPILVLGRFHFYYHPPTLLMHVTSFHDAGETFRPQSAT